MRSTSNLCRRITRSGRSMTSAQEPRSPENSTPTSFEEFVQDVFAAAYHEQASTG